MPGSKLHSETLTEGIRVHAVAEYLPLESDPAEDHHVFSYRVTLHNDGDQPAKLMSRHWVILDADNERRDVRGPGVIGKLPDLAPGESFSYRSACALGTQWGTMEGSYTFQRPDGARFEAAIGRFFLVPTAHPVKQPI